jgi:hypothetical protein
VDVLVSQGQNRVDAIRQIGVSRGDVLSAAPGVRWAETEQVKRVKDLELEKKAVRCRDVHGNLLTHQLGLPIRADQLRVDVGDCIAVKAARCGQIPTDGLAPTPPRRWRRREANLAPAVAAFMLELRDVCCHQVSE